MHSGVLFSGEVVYSPENGARLYLCTGEKMDRSEKYTPAKPEVKRSDRFAFYDLAEKAYTCSITGTIAGYGNITLKKEGTANGG